MAGEADRGGELAGPRPLPRNPDLRPFLPFGARVLHVVIRIRGCKGTLALILSASKDL